jgi:ATP-dependent RNA helicase DDX51/DBP6
MFNVDRYYPKVDKGKESSPNDVVPSEDVKRRKRAKLAENGPPALRIVANEVKIPTPSKLPQEALDDLDLVNDLIGDEELGHHESSLEIGSVLQAEVQSALSISEMPLDKAAEGWKLAQFLVDNLRRDGFEHFFPIQALVIPDVIASERLSYVRAQDICITAPTGSGKTLSYVLPILNALANKGGPRRLRALVVLPSRDLAMQVYRVFESYIVGSQLKVGLAIGQSDFVAEQIALTVDETSTNYEMLRNRLSYDPGNLELALSLSRHSPSATFNPPLSTPLIPADGWSNVDILVCTPGRLMDHLDNTRGFTLQHLRFLVVDEADRLLSQSYHKWIDRVITSSNQASIRAWKSMSKNGKLPLWRLSPDEFSVVLEPITWRRDGVTDDNTDRFATNESTVVAKVCRPIQLRKFLVSATLTKDPQKLGALRLVNPKHFNVHQLHGEVNKYSMPASLDEFIVECTAEQKPLILLSLLRERLEAQREGKTVIVIFTASLDSTHRLARLLQLLWGALKFDSDAVGEFSSALNQQDRAFLMKRCNDPSDNLSIVVCSDGMSRGMDLNYVDTVINYDVPTLAKTYVHRCGRTARASRKGAAISLLKGGQVGLFHRMRNLVQASDRVRTMQVKKDLVANALPKYRLCIQALREVLDAEANGEIGHRASVSDYVPIT